MACSKYELGYDQSRFEIEVSESFHCIICFLVLKEPVMCKNQHYYCSFCIKKHLQNSTFCPTCLEPLTVDTLKPAPRIVMDYLSELNIHCEFHPRGCLEVMKLKNLERHIESCGFSPVKCSNEGCNALVNLRDKIYHQSEKCEFRKSKCHDCCQLKQEVKELRVEILAEHDQIKSEINTIKNEVKKEVTEEIKEMTVQVLNKQNQINVDAMKIMEQFVHEVKQEMTAIKDQGAMDEEMLARQETTEIKKDLEEMKTGILSEVRE